jgi:hypothetical protein
VLVPAWPSLAGLLAPAAAGLWSIGLLLYLLLVSLILLRWLTVPMTPATLGSPYWILMGATAITVLAGGRILTLPSSIPVIKATAGFVEAFSFGPVHALGRRRRVGAGRRRVPRQAHPQISRAVSTMRQSLASCWPASCSASSRTARQMAACRGM